MVAVTGHYILYTMLNRFNFSLVRGVFLRYLLKTFSDANRTVESGLFPLFCVIPIKHLYVFCSLD